MRKRFAGECAHILVRFVYSYSLPIHHKTLRQTDSKSASFGQDMKLRLGILVFLFLLQNPVLASDKSGKSERDEVVTKIKEINEAKYVFPDRVAKINAALEALREKGEYNAVDKQKDFAQALTDDLVRISGDKHFKIQFNPELVESRRARAQRAQQTLDEPNVDEGEEEPVDWNEFYAKKDIFGFERVEILDGNVGYIKINFFWGLEWGKPTIDAAMGFVANTDALIIDMSEHGGGYSPTDCYLASYLFSGKSTQWISSFDRPTGETTSVSTFEEIGGDRYLNRPVYVLVGEETFSLGEQFAYCLKHFDKATIIGQTTSGAAHAIDFLEVNENFLIQIPIARSIHPVTKKDWQGTGVVPDVKADKNLALRAAHREAIKELLKTTDLEGLKERYRKVIKSLSEASTDK